MTRQLFSVVIVKGEWTISHGGKYHGSFPTQKDASRAAIDMAHKAAGRFSSDGARRGWKVQSRMDLRSRSIPSQGLND